MFHTFRQNNTGGSFDFDMERGISHFVVVEGDNLDEIMDTARQIGLYFDGSGDCSCCGNRWYAPWDKDDLTETPKIYDVEVPDGEPKDLLTKWMGTNPEGFIHYKAGKIVSFWPGASEQAAA